jgi:hypothetical protein
VGAGTGKRGTVFMQSPPGLPAAWRKAKSRGSHAEATVFITPTAAFWLEKLLRLKIII